MSNELDINKKDLVRKNSDRSSALELLRSNNDENRLSLSRKLSEGLEEIKAKKDFLKKYFC